MAVNATQPETYITIKGQWKYLYRALDTVGQTSDSVLATVPRKYINALLFR
ncbi:DDE-type integrase/transposase/recombinase [Serratia plymuthica]|uniref:DDE-type integrase/transposase/recombinase n=1 Tax=Serratia plymuthica TaxID=82996 RepID=UPI0009BCF831